MNNEEKIISMLETLTGKVDNIDNRLINVEDRLINVEGDVISIKVKIENEIEKNIRLLAEGHQGLVDRLWHVPDEIEDIKDSVSLLDFLQKQMIKNQKN